MKITDISVVPVEENKLRAYVNITIDQVFMVRGLKVILGSEGLFVAFPNKKGKNGMFRDVAHPLNSDTRREIEELVLAAYEKALQEGPSAKPVAGEESHETIPG